MNLTPGQGSATHKPRVAVVFGGRSSEHAVSCMTAAGVLRALDRDRYDVVPVGIATDGRWVLAEDDPDVLEARDRTLPSVDTSGPGVLVPTSTSDRSLIALRPGEVPSHPRERRRRLPAAARAVRRGRHAAGAARARRRAVRRLRRARLGGQHGQALHEGAARRPRAAGRAVRGRHAAPVGDRPRRPCLERLAGLALPVFVKPARAGLEHGHHAGRGPRRPARPPSRPPASTTPRSSSRRASSAASSSAVCCRTSTAPRGPASWARSRSSRGTPSTTSRPSTSTRATSG